MKVLKFLFVIFFVVLIIGLVGVFLGYNYYNSELKNTDGSGEVVAFTIPEGTSSDDIANLLLEKGLINDTNVFKIYLKQSGKGAQLKAGDYETPDTATIPEIVDLLTQGVEIIGIKVTLQEGLTSDKMINKLYTELTSKGATNIQKQGLANIVNDPDNQDFTPEINEFLKANKPAGKTLEGFLYPDTYEFAEDVTNIQVISKLLQNFINKTKDLGDPQSPQVTTFYEALVLASIVEKESFTNEERPIIAGIFDNRLEVGMMLQSDATITYFTGNENARATYEDLEKDSPYNTYKYTGLTPAPICNPRVESIKAALNPADTEYYYFMHEQTGTGQVHYAKTQSEHNANVREYLD